MTISRGSARSPMSIVLLAALTVSVAVTSVVTADQKVTAATRCQWMSTPVHESQNPTTKATLLTTWPNEAAKAKSKYGFTTAVGKPFKVSRTRHAGLVSVHRLYNSRTHDFLWAKSKREVAKATKKRGYTDQGIDFYSSAGGGACLEPVSRYVKAGIHRYATTARQRRTLVRDGWHYESIAFFAATTSPAVRPAPSPSLPKPAAPGPSVGLTGGPLGQRLYLSKSTAAWKAYSDATGTTKSLLYQIAGTATAIWLGGQPTDGARVDRIMDRAGGADRTPVFVLYAIPNRDCGSYSAGGLSTVGQYEDWIDSIRKGIAGRKAVIIAEPDAIGMGCLTAKQKSDRLTMLRYVLSTLSSKNTWVYLHAGSSGLSPVDVAAVLKKAGIANARGFAVNVSGFDTTARETAYGKKIISALGMSKHFVIDTSRNGLGRYEGDDGAPSWCNPPGRAVGERPTTKTGTAQVDAYLWIKLPGGSDGQCHTGDPAPGVWFQSYALGLVQRALDDGIITRRPIP